MRMESECIADFEPVLSCRGVFKSFDDGSGNRISILEDVDLDVAPGDLISICGKSGSGKSTLLHIISSLLKPDSGCVLLDGKDVYAMRDKEIMRLRRNALGFVFQDNMLLEDITVEENIILPAQIAGVLTPDVRARIADLAKEMGIDGIMARRAGLISSGEKSRVSLLRAISVGKRIIFLDEPTGALDSENARAVEELIISLAGSLGMAFVYVTHDDAFAKRAGKRFAISEKRLIRRG